MNPPLDRSRTVWANFFFLSFVALIGGRFTLSRVGDLPDVDLRFVFLYALSLGVIVWLAGASGMAPQSRRESSRAPGSHGLRPGVQCLYCRHSDTPDARLAPSLTNMFFLFIFIVIGMSVAKRLSAGQVSKIWLWLIVVAMLFLALALYSGPGPQGRYAAPGGGPNVFVRFMVMGGLAALCLYQTTQRMRFLIPIPFFTISAFSSGSRGGLLAALAVLVIAAVPIIKRNGFRLVALCLMAVTIAGVRISFIIRRNSVSGIHP